MVWGLLSELDACFTPLPHVEVLGLPHHVCAHSSTIDHV